MNPGSFRWAGARKVAVFRALMLGDMLCAVPALRALRHATPNAEIVLVGLPWARAWVARCPHVDRFIDFPGFPGLPERTPDVRAIPGFLLAMQREHFDLAVQCHGSGLLSNPVVALFGARHAAGFSMRGALALDAGCAWPEDGDEIGRLLALTDALGIPRAGESLEFPSRPEDDAALLADCPELAAAESIVCLHAGAQLPSRRWWPERFAEVAARLADRGHKVVLTGTAVERDLAETLAARAPCGTINLAGRTTLWTLGALLRRARVLVCNDTGVSHVAAALGTRSVVISLGADVSRWSPRDRRRHRVLWAPVACRPCSHRVCPTGHECAAAIAADDVAATAFALLDDAAPDGAAKGACNEARLGT